MPWRSTIGRPALLTTLVLTAIVILALPAGADHTFHVHQHTVDYASTFDAKAHTSCNPSCSYVEAEIKKSGNWYENSCSGTCTFAYSPTKQYYFPTTVYTRHEYNDGWFHGENSSHSVYYP